MKLDEGALDRLRAIGGRSLLARMANVFIEDVPKRLERLREAVAHDDRPLVARMANSLRSTASTLGGTSAAHACLVLELAAQSCDMDLVGPLTTVELAVAAQCRALRPRAA